jgi:hypothetical protein
MDYEHFVVAAARVVELTGVVVMLAGALVASLAYRSTPDAPHAARRRLTTRCGPTWAGPSCWGWSFW